MGGIVVRIAEDGCLEGLHLHGRAETGFQLIHGGSERTASFDRHGNRSFDGDGWGSRMHGQRDRRLVKMDAVNAWWVVLRGRSGVDGGDKVQMGAHRCGRCCHRGI